MDGTVVRVTLSLIAPGILCVFAATFLCVWLIERKRRYLLLLAAAFVLFSLGATSQILHWPPDTGPNAMVSGLFYTAAVLAACEGLLLRSGRQWGPLADLAILAVFMGLLWHYFYVDRNLLARVYIQNFGYGLLLLFTALRLSDLRQGRLADRALYWIFLAFALLFFPRTLLTIGFSAPANAITFADSLFWQTLQLSLAVFGVGLALAILAVTISDMMDDLRRERDTDPLTGALNRRGFEERVKPHLGMDDGVLASLVVCDIDKFKSINDTYGHPAGDAVLREVASVLIHLTGEGRIVGRLGGEEFGIFLPGTDLSDAYECAERLRKGIEESPMTALEAGRRVTGSFGVAMLKPEDSWHSLCTRADKRLYEAKNSGRNRTIASDFWLPGFPRGTGSSPGPNFSQPAIAE